MKKLAADAGLHVVVDSAGTGGWHKGELPDPRTREAASRAGYALDHRARQFALGDFDRFDLVLAMDRDNLAQLVRLARGRTSSTPPPIRLLRSFEPGAAADAEVPDPYYGDRDDFDEVVKICERACAGLLAHLRR